MQQSKSLTLVGLLLYSPFNFAEADLEELVVTASRTPQALDDVLASVTVIDRDMIERLQPQELQLLLSAQAGIDFNATGGRGATNSLFIRGANANHSLVLVDGQKIASATLGSTAIQFIDPEIIERIEIVRGPRSSLYGSDAIGGVVQIFTRGSSSQQKLRFKMGAGSESSHDLTASMHGGDAVSDYGINISYTETDGIDNLIDDSGANSDRDGYRNLSVSGNVRHRLNDSVRFGLNAFFSEGEADYDDTFVDPQWDPIASDFFSDFQLAAVSGSLELNLGEQWNMDLRVGQSRDKNNSDDRLGVDFFSPSEFLTERRELSMLSHFRPGAGHQISIGLEHASDEVSGTTDYNEDGVRIDEREIESAFAQYLYQGQVWDAQLGVRRDHYDGLDGETTATAALAWQIVSDWRMTVGAASGFKAPTFNDLYFPFSGNPNLSPESSRSTDIGVQYQGVRMSAELTLFDSEIEDLINWAPDAQGVWRPMNIDAADIRGLELSLTSELAGWHWQANASYIDSEDRNSGRPLPSRARRIGNLSLDRQWNDVGVGFDVKAQSERYDSIFSSDAVAGYAVLDARINYRINSEWQLKLKGRNLFDKQYRVRENYAREGRGWMLSFVYSPQW